MSVPPVMQFAMLAGAIHGLHYPAYNDYKKTPVCDACHGRQGTHPCGCWSPEDVQPVCGECTRRAPSGASAIVDWPCPTVRLLLDVEALAGDVA